MSLMTQPQLLTHHLELKVFEVYFDRVIVFVYLILTKSQIKHVFLTVPPPPLPGHMSILIQSWLSSLRATAIVWTLDSGETLV